ncbi:MAG TPA: hypothetical protein VI233_18020 [Puia sp.]
MIAYNRQSLDNLDIQTQAREALDKKLILTEEYDRIRSARPYHFYRPNFFIRIGLFILTTIAASCCLGLLFLVGLFNEAMGGAFIVYAVLTYGALELFIRNKKMYRAGVDDALLWIASICALSGILSATGWDPSPTMLSTTILIIALIGVLRYADHGMAILAYGAMLSLIFFRALALGDLARTFLPFLIIALSLGCYFLFTQLSQKQRLRHYHSCLNILRIAALLSLYGAGNYYIVREANAYISGQPGPIALSWLWWTLTAIIPIIYIVKGLRKKDTLFLWTGMALITAVVFTIRYYYHLMPVEGLMIIAGTLLIAGVYAIHRYLRTPKHGFTSAAPDYSHPLADLPAEAIILAETFKETGTPPQNTGIQFGGGTTGGGGAAGQY